MKCLAANEGPHRTTNLSVDEQRTQVNLWLKEGEKESNIIAEMLFNLISDDFMVYGQVSNYVWRRFEEY